MTDKTGGDVPMKKLSLVDGRSKNSPPRALGKAGQALWDRVLADFDVADAAGVELLTLACEATDRAESLRRQIDETGEIIHTRSGLRDNPLLRHELAARAFVTRTLCRLGLNSEPLRAPGRPPGGGLGVTSW
jgi:phage terminase small subunit